MAAVVGDATLAAMHEAQGLFEPGGNENGTERLAGLDRIDGQGFARQVLLTVFPALGPFGDLRGLLGARQAFRGALAGKHFPILRLPEKRGVIEGFFCTLWHRNDPFARLTPLSSTAP